MNNNYKDSNVVNISITDPRATVKIINGKPIFNHRIKLILCPYFIEIPQLPHQHLNQSEFHYHQGQLPMLKPTRVDLYSNDQMLN